MAAGADQLGRGHAMKLEIVEAITATAAETTGHISSVAERPRLGLLHVASAARQLVGARLRTFGRPIICAGLLLFEQIGLQPFDAVWPGASDLFVAELLGAHADDVRGAAGVLVVRSLLQRVVQLAVAPVVLLHVRRQIVGGRRIADGRLQRRGPPVLRPGLVAVLGERIGGVEGGAGGRWTDAPLMVAVVVVMMVVMVVMRIRLVWVPWVDDLCGRREYC